MAIQTLSNLLGYFNAGDEPTEAQFAELISTLMIPGAAGLTSVTVTTGTLAIATHSIQVGAYVINNAVDAQTYTLPAVVVGAKFLIVNTAADGGALMTIEPNASDKFNVDIAGAAGTDDKGIINTKATQIQYDYVILSGDAAAGWTIDSIKGVWVDEA